MQIKQFNPRCKSEPFWLRGRGGGGGEAGRRLCVGMLGWQGRAAISEPVKTEDWSASRSGVNHLQNISHTHTNQTQPTASDDWKHWIPRYGSSFRSGIDHTLPLAIGLKAASVEYIYCFTALQRCRVLQCDQLTVYLLYLHWWQMSCSHFTTSSGQRAACGVSTRSTSSTAVNTNQHRSTTFYCHFGCDSRPMQYVEMSDVS